MATFDLDRFIDQPSVEGLDACRKNDLFLIAQHYEISVSKMQRKEEIKRCVLSHLTDQGVFPSVSRQVPDPVTTSAAGSSPSRVLVGLQATPGIVTAEVGPPLSIPKFEPISLSTEASPNRECFKMAN